MDREISGARRERGTVRPVLLARSAAVALAGAVLLTGLGLGACQPIQRTEFDYDSPSYPMHDSDAEDSEDVPQPPDPNPPGEPVYECDPADPGTCPEGDKCSALFDANGEQNIYKCVANDAALELYDTCQPSPGDGQDACPPGTLCIARTENEEFGLCLPGCIANNDCGNGKCVISPYSQLFHCAEPCDPLLPACPSSMMCRPTVDQFGCMLGTEDDKGSFGDACIGLYEHGCAEGFACQNGELIPGCDSASGQCCTTLCDIEDGSNCPDPSICYALFFAPSPGYETLGVCLVPA